MFNWIKIEKKYLLMTTLLFLSVFQVGCSLFDDDDASSAVAECTNSANSDADAEACVQKYYQIAGAAAAEGEPQVEDENETVDEGQVPDTKILPASVTATDEEIQSKAQEIQTALKSLDESDEDSSQFQLSSTLQSSIITNSGIEKVEIGVTRLPAYEDEEQEDQEHAVDIGNGAR